VVEADVAAIKVAGGMVSSEGLGEAMVLWRRELGLRGGGIEQAAKRLERLGSHAAPGLFHQQLLGRNTGGLQHEVGKVTSIRKAEDFLSHSSSIYSRPIYWNSSISLAFPSALFLIMILLVNSFLAPSRSYRGSTGSAGSSYSH
jgi:hypothetical protein